MNKISKEEGVSILVLGGSNPLQQMGSSDAGSRIFRYFVASQQWKEDMFLPEPRHHPAVAFLDHQIYIIGGCNPHSTQNGSKICSLNSVLCYDIRTDDWLNKCHMISCRIHHAVLTRNGKIFAIGGLDEQNRLLRSVEYYDPYKNEWTEMAPLSSPRMAMSAAIHDGEIWVCGGIGYSSDTTRQKVVLASVENYNFTSNSWSRRIPGLRFGRCFSTLVDSFGQLVLVGGAVNTKDHPLYLKSISSIDVFDGRWSFKTDLLQHRHSCASAVLGCHLYLIGGVASEDSSALSSVERVDLMTWQSQWMPPMPLALSGMVAVCVPKREKHC